MTNSVGPSAGTYMLLLLEHQQQLAEDNREARDTLHETGVALLEVGHVFREIEEKSREWERTMSYVNAGIAVVQAGIGVGGAIGNASAGTAETPTIETSSEVTPPEVIEGADQTELRADNLDEVQDDLTTPEEGDGEDPDKKDPDPLKMAKDVLSNLPKLIDNGVQATDQVAKDSKEHSDEASDRVLEVSQEARSAYQEERELTELVIDTLLRRNDGEIPG